MSYKIIDRRTNKVVATYKKWSTARTNCDLLISMKPSSYAKGRYFVKL